MVFKYLKKNLGIPSLFETWTIKSGALKINQIGGCNLKK